jgi:hypothetical protein
MNTVVYQSYKPDGGPAWIRRCLDTVRGWALSRGFDYEFIGDEIFDRVPGWYRDRAANRIPVITDLGRLLLARDFLTQGYERTIWLDADVLVFDPDGLDIAVTEEYAFGAELWVQKGTTGKWQIHRNVHNAISVFTAGNSFLDFYIHACRSVVGRLEGGTPPQIVGPKLLTTLHNIIGFPLIAEVGMLSPPVLRDIAAGSGPAFDLLKEHTPGSLAAANLCSSLVGTARDGVAVTDELVDRVCTCLLKA